MNELIKTKIDNIPLDPGVYLMKNKEGEVIYVGKAKSLKKRVPQYFLRPHEGKTQKMVSEVVDFDVIIVESEREALILEMNQIHKYNPKYNILLKDDRAYPYIEVNLKGVPYLKIARKITNRNSLYFGPYPDSKAAYETLNLLNRLFPLKKCNKIPKSECLYYHLNQCLAPCIKDVKEEDYKEIVNDIKKLMNGDFKDTINNLKKEMNEYSENLMFEKAKECLDKIKDLEYILSKQKVDLKEKKDLDVFAFHVKNGYIAIAILMYNKGVLSLKDTKTFPYIDKENEILVNFIYEFYQMHRLPKEIIAPSLEEASLLEEVLNIKVTIPSQGYKKELLQMAASNAIKAMEDAQMVKVVSEDKVKLLTRLQELVNIKYPKTIEMIDNSHIQGDDAVGSVVVYVNGESQKKLYRKYKINHKEKRDDIASMREILYRRYYRILVEKGSCSDLLIVDGGMNQLNAAKEVLTSLGFTNVDIIGLVKNDKHVTRAIVNSQGEEIALEKDDPLLFFLTRMQDEVHRFAITFHKNLRSKSMTYSLLDSIKGLGEVRKEKLLKTYGNLKNIVLAPLDELTQLVPLEVAKKIKEIKL